MNSNLGEILRYFRKAHHYTQEFVARQLGITRQAYGHYENSLTTPDSQTLFQLSSLYEIPFSAFIEDADSFSGRIMKENGAYHTQAPSFSINYSEFLEYYKNPDNINKYHTLTRKEKELLFYFQKLSSSEQHYMICITYLKSLPGI